MKVNNKNQLSINTKELFDNVEGFKAYHDGLTKYYLNDRENSGVYLIVDISQNFQYEDLILSDIIKTIALEAYKEGQKHERNTIINRITGI